MINVADKSKSLRLKLVYNKDGYTTLPTAVDEPFIEPMELQDGQEYKVKINAKDVVVRPVVADKEIKNDNPFMTTAPEIATATFNATTSDLPF